MTGILALAALVAALGTLQVLLSAVVVAVMLPLIRPWLEAAALAGRTRLLALLSGLPLLSGVVLVTACLWPSLSQGLGLSGDHCLVHIDHALHLCLAHLPSTAPPLSAAIAVAVGLIMTACASWRAATLLCSGRDEAHVLAAISHQRGEIRWIESRFPLALTVGLLRPRIYVSSGLERGLDDAELDAAIAHERCHSRERHALLKLLATVSGTFHLPRVQRELGSLLDLACERRADECAAIHVDDRVRVASALVRAHRLVAAQPSTTLAFADGSLSRVDLRVRALLMEPATSRRHWWPLGAAVASLALATIGNHELHHAAEHLLALLV